jgi:hypothetical protein
MTAVEVMTNYIAAMRVGISSRVSAISPSTMSVMCPGAPRWPGNGEGARRSRATSATSSRTPGGNVSVELLDMLVGDVHVELMVPEKLGDDEHRVEVRRVNVYRVKNDTIVEIRIFEGDQYAMDEFTGGVRSGQR